MFFTKIVKIECLFLRKTEKECNLKMHLLLQEVWMKKTF